jgi:hypothetical protein
VLEKPYNHHLCFRLALTPGEVVELMDKLPATVTSDLAIDLETSQEAQKYDLETQTAYAFKKVGTGLVCWSWCDVRSYGEAGRLLAAVINLSNPLNPLLACQLYTAATDRPSALDAEHMPGDAAPYPPEAPLGHPPA